MKVKEESEKVGLKLNIQKTKITASSPITSWEIDGETVETVSDFIFLGCKITADDDCSHEIKRCLLLGKSHQVAAGCRFNEAMCAILSYSGGVGRCAKAKQWGWMQGRWPKRVLNFNYTCSKTRRVVLNLRA